MPNFYSELTNHTMFKHTKDGSHGQKSMNKLFQRKTEEDFKRVRD